MTASRVVSFGWPRPPLSMNDRHHHMQKAKLTAMIRKAAADAFGSFPPVSRVEVRMVWTVRDKRRRDEENPVATMKALCDGLVDAGVVPDDTHAFMVKLMPVIEHVPGGVPDVRLEVKEIP